MYKCQFPSVVVLGFTTLLTPHAISIAFYSEHEKSDKYCPEALISAWDSFTCCKSMTWDPQLYFPSEGSHTQDFYTLKESINPDRVWTCEPRIQSILLRASQYGAAISDEILSEIYLQNFESQHINIISKHNISFYDRYVYDILIICNETKYSWILLLRKATVIWPKYSFLFRFISIRLSDAHPRAGRCSRQS